MVTNLASPPVGKPRTAMFGPETPPVVSAQMPGTCFSTSAALIGAAALIASPLSEVTA